MCAVHSSLPFIEGEHLFIYLFVCLPALLKPVLKGCIQTTVHLQLVYREINGEMKVVF